MDKVHENTMCTIKHTTLCANGLNRIDAVARARRLVAIHYAVASIPKM